MFGVNIPRKLISEQKLAKLTEILGTVGLDDPNHYGFQRHVQNAENYRGSSGFEWSERGKDMRFYFNAFEGMPIHSVDVFVLSGGKNSLYSPEVIELANKNLRELFAD